LKKLFGLDGTAPHPGDSVWSQTLAQSGRNASQSTSHGGFDDDRATMESVLRQVLGRSDTDHIEPNPNFVSGGRSLAMKQQPLVSRFAAAISQDSGTPAMPPFQPSFTPARGGGRRRALCIGINSYASQALFGCVADAQLWANTLQSLGFESQLLIESNATYEGLRAALNSLVSSAKPGDVIVVQYSGHGTTIPRDGAEPDEALVPIDFFTTGALLLDKELAAIFNKTPASVNLTCFFDCCNSGDITRLLLAGQAASRPRFIQLTPAQVALFNQFSSRRGLALLPDRARGERDISFAACRRDESAFETGGNGDFTRATTKLLQGGSIPALSNQEFQSRIVSAFGVAARQHPQLIGAMGLFGRRLLEPFVSPAQETTAAASADGSGTASPPPATMTPPQAPLHQLAEALRQFAEYVDKETVGKQA
jgi:hypothetical protein